LLLSGPEFAKWLANRPSRAVPLPAEDAVLIARDGDVLHLSLNRPARHNAFNRELRDELYDALEIALLDDSVTSVMIDGVGPSFCSGGDLDEFGTTPDVLTAHLIRTQRSVGRRLDQLRDKVTVTLHGSCIGAGIELPTFAGHVIASPGATFALPELAMGLIPGAGGTVSLPSRIGRWRTAYLALTGVPIDATTALAWGLVDELTTD
jgi:enoyl-CoA hydratase/carnithine racemase